MSRSSARRAQVEPLPALVAVAVLCLAVGAYASVRAGVAPVGGSGPPADAVLSETVDAATDSGSVVVTRGPSGSSRRRATRPLSP